MTDLAKRLDEIVGGLAVVFDDQEAHLRVGCGQVRRLSLTMARAACRMQGDRGTASAHDFGREEKWAVKLGDLTAHQALPTEGGVFHRKVTVGSELWPAPRKEPSAGATDAGDTFQSRLLDQPLASGTATKRDEPPLFTRIRTLFLLSVRAALIASRTSPALATRLAGDFEDDVAFLEAALGCRALRIDVGDHDAFLAGAGHAVGGRNRQAELRHVGAALRRGPCRCCRCRPWPRCVFGNWPSVRLTTLSWPLCSTLSFTALPGAKPPMVRASSRASLTGLPLTAVMTSPDSMPALAAGPLACGSATSAPSAFFRPRLSAMSARHRLDLHADPAAADRALVLELGDHRLHGRGRNRERDADAAAGRRIDRGVDAHHFAVGVEGRATGVALVHRRIDLDEIVIRTVADVAAARPRRCRRSPCRRGRTDCRPPAPSRRSAACRRTAWRTGSSSRPRP